jgi:hypothetical protein
MMLRSFCVRNALAALVTVAFVTLSPVLAQQDGLTNAGADRVVSIGRLIRSGQARNGTPRYALLDVDGVLTAYVVPASGVGLAKHVNQPVVISARNVSQDVDGRPYLLAQHVTAHSVQAGQESTGSEPRNESGSGPAELAIDEPRIVMDWEDETNKVDELEGDVDWDEPAPPHEFDVVQPARVRHDDAVLLAADYDDEFDESMVEPAEILPMAEGKGVDEPYLEPAITSCANPDCSHCAPSGPCTSNCCPCGPAGRYWFRTEYLAWWTDSVHTPPLVTTAPITTAAQDAGVLGVSGTEVIAGGDTESLSRNGVRFLLGGWVDPCQHRGWEVDYFFLEEELDSFSRSSIGDPILARPFFNTQLNIQDAELVAYPGIVSGTVNVDYRSEYQSLTPRFRQNLRCDNIFPVACGGCGNCDGRGSAVCGPLGGSRVDVSLGYRYMRLREGLRISEDLISEAESTFATFNIYDAFEVSNEFHGFELGLLWDRYRGRWSMELASRFALGNNTRRVAINGGTRSVIQGVAFEDVGGLLALPSNIGAYEDDEFVVIPELSATLGYQLAPNVRFLVGYTFIYWNNVVRPGDQIDLNVNPDLMPPAVNTTGLSAPAFAMNDASFWAQGINLGLDWRW